MHGGSKEPNARRFLTSPRSASRISTKTQSLLLMKQINPSLIPSKREFSPADQVFSLLVIICTKDLDLQIRGEAKSFRPRDKGRGAPVSKKLFLALRASVSSKNKGDWARASPAPPLDPSLG